MILLLAVQLGTASSANAPRTLPVPTVENVRDAQPSDYSGNIIINGVCLDVIYYPTVIDHLSCERTARFDEFACSYNVLWEGSSPALGSYWEQRMDIIFQNVEGKSVRTRELAAPKTWKKGRWRD